MTRDRWIPRDGARRLSSVAGRVAWVGGKLLGAAVVAAMTGLGCGGAATLPAALQFDGLDDAAVVRINGDPLPPLVVRAGAVRVHPGQVRVLIEQPGYLPAYVDVEARPNGVYLVAPVLWPCFEELDADCVR